MIDLILWVTGAIVWAAIFSFCSLIAWEILFGFCVAADFFFWSHKCLKLNGKKSPWRALPKAFLRRWYEFAGMENGSITFSSRFGEWRGFRNWESRKAVEMGEVK